MVYKDKRELLHALIKRKDRVLDVGFLGQGVKDDSPHWPHRIIKELTDDVWGIDLELTDQYQGDGHYFKASAEEFRLGTKFNVIFAGDLIEHLSNPGLFLACCKKHLKPDGILILVTPNTFNLFNMAEKLTKFEPTINSDHTAYHNCKTLNRLLGKNGMRTIQVAYLLNSTGYTHKESWKKKFLNAAYWFASKFTEKFMEGLVVVAR